jgi:hypothetical protein
VCTPQKAGSQNGNSSQDLHFGRINRWRACDGMNGDRELKMEVRGRTILGALFLVSAFCLPEAKAGVIVENLTITGGLVSPVQVLSP